MKDNTTWSLVGLVWPLLILGLVWVTWKVGQLISLKVKNERLKSTLAVVDIAVTAATQEVQQVLVDGYKAANPQGVLTPEQRREAKQAALESARAQLSTHGIGELQAAWGWDRAAVDALLARRIEAAVYGLRARRRTWEPGSAGDAVPFTE